MSEHKGRRMLDKHSEGGSMRGNYVGAYMAPAGEPADSRYSGTANPGIEDSRPIARSNPDLGKCSVKDGCAFKIPMGDQSDPYS